MTRFVRSSLLAALLVVLGGTHAAWAEGPPVARTAAAPVHAAPVAPRPVQAPKALPAPARIAKPLDARPPARVALRPQAQVQTPSLDVAVPPATARVQLLSVHDEVQRKAQLGEHPVVVFDIDDTLLTWPTPDHPRTPIPGALAYVTSLKKAGATIVYMTGRKEDQRGATEADLREHGFPVGRDEVLLLNGSTLHTVDYKAAATRAVVRVLGTPVAAFDNDKANVRVFRRELPDPSVSVVRLRTTTERQDIGGTGPIVVVDDFSTALPPAAPAP